MRTFLFIVLTLLMPFGLWVSGCRREPEQAVLPNTPEMERLARSPGTTVEDALAQPYVPALIDPEIFAAPDQPTYARIRTVMDREAALAGSMNQPGLFVLPRQEYPEMAVLPQQNLQAAPASTPEIWTRQVDNAMSQNPIRADNPDLSAMAPASQPYPAAFVPQNRQPAAYPAYTLPQDLPQAPAPALPAESPTGIPGMYFGPDNMVLDALAPLSPLSEAPKTSAKTTFPDFFGDSDLGLLASINSLDALSSLYTPQGIVKLNDFAAEIVRENAGKPGMLAAMRVIQPSETAAMPPIVANSISQPQSAVPPPPAEAVIAVAAVQPEQPLAQAVSNNSETGSSFLDISALIENSSPAAPAPAAMETPAAAQQEITTAAAPAAEAAKTTAAADPAGGETSESLVEQTAEMRFGDIMPPEIPGVDNAKNAQVKTEADNTTTVLASDSDKAAVKTEEKQIKNTWGTFQAPARRDHRTRLKMEENFPMG